MRIINVVFSVVWLFCARSLMKFVVGLDAEFGRIVSYDNFDQYKVIS